MAQCRWRIGSGRFEGTMLFRNSGKWLPGDASSYRRSMESSTTRLWKRRNLLRGTKQTDANVSILPYYFPNKVNSVEVQLLYIWSSVCLSVCLSVHSHPPIHLSISQSIIPSIHSFAHLSTCPYPHPPSYRVANSPTPAHPRTPSVRHLATYSFAAVPLRPVKDH